MTVAQELILSTLEDLTEWLGYPPTIREIAADRHCAVNAIYQHLVALERQGLVERAGGNKSRTWRSVRTKGIPIYTMKTVCQLAGSK